MNIHDACAYLKPRFVYRSDPKNVIGDSWRVMREVDGKMYGDCDDYTFTAFWLHSDRKLTRFLWRVFVSGDYQALFAKAPDGTSHLVGTVDNLWFDNWAKEPLQRGDFLKRTGHVITRRASLRVIGWQMLVGYIRGK